MEINLDSELIILEVEKHPLLYDSRDNDFKNRELRNDAWMAVNKQVIGVKWEELDNKTKADVGKEIKRRWRNLKDRYLRSVKDEAGKSGDASKTKRPYVYHRQMMFLQAVYSQRETLGNMNEDDTTINNDASEEPISGIEEPAIVAGPSSRLPKKRKLDSFERDVLKILQANVGRDEDEMFLLSHLPYIKKMKENAKFQFKIQFLKLVHKYSNECEITDTETSFSGNNALSTSSATFRTSSEAELDVDNDSLSSF